MFRVMTVRVEPKTMAESGLTAELFFRNALDETDETTVNVIELASNFGECEASFLFRHVCIEGINPAMCCRVSGRLFPVENGRQVFERLFLPGRNVSEDISYRPLAGDARLQQFRIWQPSVGFLEAPPCLFQPRQELPPVHGHPILPLG
jgi:hypothetical protein